MKYLSIKLSRWIFLLWISIFYTHAVSQNLVQNNGFDRLRKGVDEYSYYSMYWRCNDTTAYYFKRCGSKCGYYHSSAKKGKSTIRKARSKSVFAGIYAVGNKNKRGFISTKLISPLDSGRIYYFQIVYTTGFFLYLYKQSNICAVFFRFLGHN